MTQTINISKINAMKEQCAKPKPWFDFDMWEGRYYAYGTSIGEIWLDPRCPCCAKFFARKTVSIFINLADTAEVFGKCTKCGLMQPNFLWGD